MKDVRDLAQRLRSSTEALHLKAERSGYIAEILRKRSSLQGYGLFLRNLEPAYGALEQALQGHADQAALAAFDWPPLYRHRAIVDDLSALADGPWHEAFRLLPEGRAYAERILKIEHDAPHRLLGHAYVRYVGDLSGGRIVQAILMKSPGLEPDSLTFYDFADITDAEDYKNHFRDRLNGLTEKDRALDEIVDEASVAFQCNIEVSLAVQRAMQADGSGI